MKEKEFSLDDIITEGTFRPEKLAPIAERFGLDPKEVIENAFYAIKKIMKEQKLPFKILFQFKEIFHKILYKNNEIISVENEDKMKTLSNKFYLIQLINSAPYLVNYIYEKDFIISINNEIKNIENEYKLILEIKFIIDLISYYKQTDNYNEQKDYEILEKILQENIKRINQLEKFNFTFIKDEKLDYIYLYIINLVENDILCNSNLKNKIFEHLEILDINFIKERVDIIIEDLFEGKKINFLYNLLKNIGNNLFYFDSFEFLSNIKKKFQELIISLEQKDIKNIIKNKDKDFYDKFEYIKKTLSSLEDNLKINNKIKNESSIIEEKKNKSKKDPINNDIIKNSKNKINMTKISNICENINETKARTVSKHNTNNNITKNYKLNKNEINNKNLHSELILKLLNHSSFYLSTIFQKNEKNFMFNKIILIGEYKIELPYEQFKKLKEIPLSMEDKNIYFENFKLLLKFQDRIIDDLKKNFRHSYNLRLLLDFKKDENNYNKDTSICFINCKYTFFHPMNNNRCSSYTSYEDSNIFIQEENSYKGFELIIYDINNEVFKNIEYKEYNPKSNNIQETQNIIKKEQKIQSKISGESSYIMPMAQNNYTKIKIKVVNIQDLNQKTNVIYPNIDFIKQLSSNYNLRVENRNKLLILDNNFNKKCKLKLKDEEIINVSKAFIYDNTQKNYIQLFIFCEKSFYFITIDLSSNLKQIKKFLNSNIKNYIDLRNNCLLFYGKKGAFIINKDIFTNNNNEEINLDKFILQRLKGSFKAGIYINENMFALIKGKDKLLFYHVKTYNIINIINTKNFSISLENLSLISIKKKQKKKLLLCACKTNGFGGKNGILIIDTLLGKIEQFIDIYNLEPDFLKTKENGSSNFNLLIGGFDREKRLSLIKILNIRYNKSFQTECIYNISDNRINSMVYIPERKILRVFDIKKIFVEFTFPFYRKLFR